MFQNICLSLWSVGFSRSLWWRVDVWFSFFSFFRRERNQFLLLHICTCRCTSCIYYTPVYHKIKCICLHIGAHTLCHWKAVLCSVASWWHPNGQFKGGGTGAGLLLYIRFLRFFFFYLKCFLFSFCTYRFPPSWFIYSVFILIIALLLW